MPLALCSLGEVAEEEASVAAESVEREDSGREEEEEEEASRSLEVSASLHKQHGE